MGCEKHKRVGGQRARWHPLRFGRYMVTLLVDDLSSWDGALNRYFISAMFFYFIYLLSKQCGWPRNLPAPLIWLLSSVSLAFCFWLKWRPACLLTHLPLPRLIKNGQLYWPRHCLLSGSHGEGRGVMMVETIFRVSGKPASEVGCLHLRHKLAVHV